MQRLGEMGPTDGRSAGAPDNSIEIDMWWQGSDRVADEPGGEERFFIGGDLNQETGHDAVLYARTLSKLRDNEAIDAGGLGGERTLFVRKFDGIEYWNLRGALVDKRFGEKTEAIMIKFGSDAYFDFLLARPDFQKVLATSKFVIVMVTDELAVVIHPSDGLEQLSEENARRIEKN
jgi:hypothetical protein